MSETLRLEPSDAVAAIIITQDDEYLLQLRDDKPEIWFPDYWGLFGGAIDPGETADEALVRELFEELNYVPEKYTRFSGFKFDFGFAGKGDCNRVFYEITIDKKIIPDLVLGEGSKMQLFSIKEVEEIKKVVPYDEFAIHLHLNKQRFK